MSPAMERYLEEEDPLKKTLATWNDKGRSSAFGHTSVATQNTLEELEKHMKEHQGKCIIDPHHKLR